MTTQETLESIEKLQRYDLTDNGGCDDPECCGGASYYIGHDEKGEFLKRDAVLAIIRKCK